MDLNHLEGIKTYHDSDILCGKSKLCNQHPGNKKFRNLIKDLKPEYIALPKNRKKEFAQRLLYRIQTQRPPGRFLKQSAENLLWFDIGHDQALFKVRQALREGAPNIEVSIKLGNLKVQTVSLHSRKCRTLLLAFVKIMLKCKWSY